MDRPWFPLYTRDWLDDIELRNCGEGARALLTDLMCLAHEGTPYGYLADKRSQPLSEEYMAGRCNLKASAFRRYVAELERRERLHRDGALFFIKRMVKNEQTRVRRASGGFASVGHPNTPPPRTLEGYPSESKKIGEEGGQHSRERAGADSDSDVLGSLTQVSEELPKPRARVNIPARRTTVTDEQWPIFLDEANSHGMKGSEVDWDNASWEWGRLDIGERLAAIQGLSRDVIGKQDALPVNYLKKKMWQRPERRAPQHPAAGESKVHRLMRERIEQEEAENA